MTLLHLESHQALARTSVDEVRGFKIGSGLQRDDHKLCNLKAAKKFDEIDLL
jgi:hypothetical protein